ncbi:hypothetical protein [uncultured Sneathiella sp.]|uniref:hypothetical protein n=1 Tax=uncultured Sneathiella sp. TaxID=879315 RepID=UPI0030EF1AB2
MTEREMEDLLVSERRELVSSGGDRQVVTADRLFWLRLDLLLQAFITTLDDVYRYTYMDMAAQNTSFADSFKAVVVYIDNRVQ